MRANYSKAEVSFNKNDELDMHLEAFVLEKSIIIGKSNYLKTLIYQDYLLSKEKEKEII